MNIKRALATSLVVCLILLVAGCDRERDDLPETLVTRQTSGINPRKEVILVPLGDFPTQKVEELVRYYREKFQLPVKTVPPVKLGLKDFDIARGQLIAEQTLETMQWGYPRLSGDPRAVMIGLTDIDMYIRGKNWRFTFSLRNYGRFAVVSSARMKLSTRPAGPELVASRLRKMVTKNIGIMYYELEPSADPQSVLYDRIGGLEELDYMGEDF